jgi:hypothetical protein
MNEFIKKIEASGWRLPAVIDRLRELAAGECFRTMDIPWLTALADALFVISATDTIAQAEKLQEEKPGVIGELVPRYGLHAIPFATLVAKKVWEAMPNDIGLRHKEEVLQAAYNEAYERGKKEEHERAEKEIDHLRARIKDLVEVASGLYRERR